MDKNTSQHTYRSLFVQWKTEGYHVSFQAKGGLVCLVRDPSCDNTIEQVGLDFIQIRAGKRLMWFPISRVVAIMAASPGHIGDPNTTSPNVPLGYPESFSGDEF